MYYVGEATLSGEAGQAMGSQVILLEKTHDPGQNLIVERAIVVKPGGQAAEEHTMEMKVDGDRFTIKDLRNTVQGNGKLFGPAWRWTYFKAEYASANGAKIEDENYMNDPAVLVARKKISAPSGKVLMYMDVTLKAITPETFKILASNLLRSEASAKPAAP